MRLVHAVVLGLVLASAGARAADPSALWKIVNGRCVPHEESEHTPSPCAEVNLADGVDKGFAVLKDREGIAQFLLIPTARISGIDDPAILATGATNYWEAAWQARYFVDETLHASLPRDAFALAINSAEGRSQNQLHIHIDCIRPDVRRTLAENLESVTTAWTLFPLPLAGHMYRSIRINGQTLGGTNPFRVLADHDSQIESHMGIQTLVLVGEVFPDGSTGFILLDDHADLAAGNRASGEELEDHSCAVATQ